MDRLQAAITQQRGLRLFSSSALRFTPVLGQACRQIRKPLVAHAYGPLGQARAGFSIVWYGVYTFDMMQPAMGPGAQTQKSYDGGKEESV